MMSKPKGNEGPWKADKIREASNGRLRENADRGGGVKKIQKVGRHHSWKPPVSDRLRAANG